AFLKPKNKVQIYHKSLKFQNSRLKIIMKIKFIKKFLQLLSALLLTLMISSCATPCYDYPCMGADEFVADSHMIRKGKLAILELEGKTLPELSEETMCEYLDTISEDDV